MKRSVPLYHLTLSAMLLAVALLLPFLTGQLKHIGNMLCPMHFPILLCGFFCGWQWGLAVGVTAPILRSFLFSMPAFFPSALCMCVELGCYGFLSGLLYQKLPGRKWAIYLSLLSAMTVGRILWGVARWLCVGADTERFGLSLFWTGAVVTAIPGILLQILLIPLLVMLGERMKRGQG